MNREILFRGKRVDNGEWVEGSLMLYTGVVSGNIVTEIFWDGKHGEDKTWQHSTSLRCLVNPSTVGQYTGLIDRNGKWIFEGDRFKGAWDKKGTIVYLGHQALFGMKYDEKAEVYEFGIIRGIDIEVIGNIHDNPELLEAKQ